MMNRQLLHFKYCLKLHQAPTATQMFVYMIKLRLPCVEVKIVREVDRPVLDVEE